MENVSKYYEVGYDLILTYGPRLVGALFVLIVGLFVIRIAMRMISKAMTKSSIDDSLRHFLRSLFGTLLKVLLAISILGMIGIEMTSFIALLGAAGLAVGMALSGTLQNFAGGVIILVFKPFTVGDVIETQGYIGSVAQIQIFNTILKTGDNKTIIIPNGGLSNSSMINYNAEPTRRLEWTFGIGYNDDYEKAKSVIRAVIEKDERILETPAPFLALSAMADSSVNIMVRVWVKSENYWGVNFDMNESVYMAFNKEGISIPYPQMDVHLQKE